MLLEVVFISNSKSTRAGVFLLIFLFPKSLFEFLPSLLKESRIVKRIICRLRLLGLFRFFDLGVLHSNSLIWYLSSNNMNRIIASLGLVVHLLNVRSRLYTSFGLSFNCFFNHFYPSVQFLTFLFYLSLYRGLKVFPKKSNKVRLF